jgi:hypothetical protein
MFKLSLRGQVWCLALFAVVACGTGDHDRTDATPDSLPSAARKTAQQPVPSQPASDSAAVRDTAVPDSATLTTQRPMPDTAAADSAPKVTVLVCVERRDSATVYSYQIHNGTNSAARLWQLGWVAGPSDEPTDAPLGGGELFTYPAGADTTSVSGDEPLGAASVRTPPHWTATLQHVEDSNGAVVTWRLIDSVATAKSAFAIHAGQTKSGFSVVVPTPDEEYERGHFTLIPGTAVYYVGRVRRARVGEMPCPTAQ